MTRISQILTDVRLALLQYVPEKKRDQISPELTRILYAFRNSIEAKVKDKRDELFQNGITQEKAIEVEATYLGILYEIHESLTEKDYLALKHAKVDDMAGILTELSKWHDAPNRELIKQQNEDAIARDWEWADEMIKSFETNSHLHGYIKGQEKTLKWLRELRDKRKKRSEEYEAKQQEDNVDDSNVQK